LSQVGVGARSTIHKVVLTATGKIFALKRVVRQDDEDDRFIVQAETEHRVAAQVSHKHLRHSYSIHRVKKWTRIRELYVVMEYVEGMTLEAARPNRLDWFLQIVRKVAAGLDALHDTGYVHADIKPNNVILGPAGVVKIIDFGQSCTIGHRKERIQGTPDYIAPEQVRRMPLSQATDVFNLGATMYWVLTDTPFPTQFRQPIRGGSIDLVGPKEALTPKQINGKIPAVLSQLVMDCCRDNPAERPEDMKQLAARLDVVQRMWHKQQSAAKARARAKKESKSASTPGRRIADEAPHD
jgi:serine/threonine-protein kinase